MTTDRKSIADKLRERGFSHLTEDQYQDNIRQLVPTVYSCEKTAMTTDKVTGTFEAVETELDAAGKAYEELKAAAGSPHTSAQATAKVLAAARNLVAILDVYHAANLLEDRPHREIGKTRTAKSVRIKP